MQNNILMPGDSAGNYDKKWTETFDLKFLILWLILFVFLLSWTLIFDPNLFNAKAFLFKDGPAPTKITGILLVGIILKKSEIR